MACVHQHEKFFRGTDSLLHELCKWRLKHFLRPCEAWTKRAQRSQLFCHRTTIPHVEKVGSKGAIRGGLGAGRDAVLATFHAHRMKISGSGLHLTKGLCLSLMALPTEQHWPGSLQAMGIHDYPLCSRAPGHTLTHPDTPWHTLTYWHTLKNVCGHGSPCHLPWLVQNTATLAWRFWLYGQQHSITELDFTIALPRGSRSFGAPCSVVWLSFCVSITIINKNCLHLNFLFLMG